MNSVLAVIVTYNRLNMLKECVRHLLSQSYACDILIVDNASTDETQTWARELIQNCSNDSSFHILYENTGRNTGGAGGFHFGMKTAYKLNYQYVWVMDDDSMAEPDCLQQLMKAAQTIEDFGFLSSAVLWKDGTLCRMNWQRKYPLPRKRSERHLLESDLTKSKVQVQSCTFVSALFPVQLLARTGLPIKEFFIWCDDIEFTRRITLKHHLPAYVIPSSRIVHYINNNEGTNLAADDAPRIPRYNYAFRNENYMYRQYGIKGFLYYLIVVLYNTFTVITKAPDNKLKRLAVIYRNLFSGLFFNPEIEYPDPD